LCRQIELYGGRIRRSNRQKPLRDQVEVQLKRLFGKHPNGLTLELRHLLAYCEQLFGYQKAIDGEFKRLASDNEVCRRLMTIPGVGPICALTFYAIVSDPHRFRRSQSIGSYLGLTPRVHQSGLSNRAGRISRMGNAAMRTLLVQAALAFMRSRRADPALRSWALSIEQRSGRGQSRIALARKLAVIMVAMWKRGEAYCPSSQLPAGLPAG
jgi:transposase